MRVIGVMEKKNRSAQQDSKMLAVRLVPQSGDPISPYRPLAIRLVPQSGDPYRPLDLKTSPAQRDSKMSNWGVGSLGILRSLGILGCKAKSKTSPAQRDSKMSKMKKIEWSPEVIEAWKALAEDFERL